MSTRLHLGDLAIFGFLTILVWGINPIDRGIRFASDDLGFYYQAWLHRDEPVLQQATQRYFADLPTRSLAFWPFVVAANIQHPTLWLQCFYALSWLLNGIAAARFVGALLPESRLVQFIVGCLVLTATSDYMTNSVVYGPHLFGIALFFFGAGEMVRCNYPASGRLRLFVAAMLLSLSFFTVEYTFPGVPFFFLLLVVHGRMKHGKWPIACPLVLLLTFLPAALLVIAKVLQPGSHASVILTPKATLAELCQLIVRHFVHNLSPIEWIFREIPPWRHDYESVFPLVLFVSVSFAGSLIVAIQLFRLVRQAKPLAIDHPRTLIMVALLAFLAAGAINATMVNGGGYYIRSHFASRIWCSIGLTLVFCALSHLTLVRRVLLGLVPVFVFAGVWGGIERQSFFTGYELHERLQLQSFVAAVPNAPPDKKLVVIHPPGSPSMTALDHASTLSLVYNEPGVRDRVLLAANSEERYSIVTGADGDRLVVVFANDIKSVVQASDCIILFFSPARGQYIRLDSIPAGLFKNAPDFSAKYNPRNGILTGMDPGRSYLVRDRLAELIFHSTPPRRTQLYGRSNTIIVPELRDALTVELFAPHALERLSNRYMVWLGYQPTEGFSLLVWADKPMLLAFRAVFEPGPDRSLQDIPLRFRCRDAMGGTQSSSSAFHEPTQRTFLAQVSPGPNIVEFWTDDPGTAIIAGRSDQRRLIAMLREVLISPASPLVAKSAANIE